MSAAQGLAVRNWQRVIQSQDCPERKPFFPPTSLAGLWRGPPPPYTLAGGTAWFPGLRLHSRAPCPHRRLPSSLSDQAGHLQVARNFQCLSPQAQSVLHSQRNGVTSFSPVGAKTPSKAPVTPTWTTRATAAGCFS